MPPSLSVSNGVPDTVTPPVSATVNETVLPAPSGPETEGVASMSRTVTAGADTARMPAGLTTAPLRFAIWPRRSVTPAPFRLTAVTARSGVAWPVATVVVNTSVSVPEPEL